MIDFYHGNDLVMSRLISENEAITIIMSMLHNFHEIWTFKKRASGGSRE